MLVYEMINAFNIPSHDLNYCEKFSSEHIYIDEISLVTLFDHPKSSLLTISLISKPMEEETLRAQVTRGTFDRLFMIGNCDNPYRVRKEVFDTI